MDKDFNQLHRKLVNLIIQYCNEHDIDATDVTLRIDSLRDSLEFGEWYPSTDSSLTIYKKNVILKESI